MRARSQNEENQFELADQIIMIEKLIREKEIQIKMFKDWLRRTQEKGNVRIKKMDAKTRPQERGFT